MKKLNKILLFCSVIVLASSCSRLEINLKPYVDGIGMATKHDATAAIIVSYDDRADYTMHRPRYFQRVDKKHFFPFGQAMADASEQAFSQVFKKVVVVDSFEEGVEYDIMIEPTIEKFQFHYSDNQYGGRGEAAFTQIRMKFTAFYDGEEIWEREILSNELMDGPWNKGDINYEEVGKLVSIAIVYCVKEAAKEIARDESFLELFETY